MGPEPWIILRITHDEYSVLKNRIIAKSNLSRGLLDIDSSLTFQNLKLLRQQGDSRHFCLEMRLGLFAQQIEFRYLVHLDKPSVQQSAASGLFKINSRILWLIFHV